MPSSSHKLSALASTPKSRRLHFDAVRREAASDNLAESENESESAQERAVITFVSKAGNLPMPSCRCI